jgi:hypothetical protein
MADNVSFRHRLIAGGHLQSDGAGASSRPSMRGNATKHRFPVERLLWRATALRVDALPAEILLLPATAHAPFRALAREALMLG